jgi:peptide/nickel transport system ATP-binding protein
MIFQEPMTSLNPVLTVGNQVAEGLRLHRGLDAAAARAEALRLLDRVQLPQAAARLQAYPHQLSGGQRQRVVLAIALAGGPQLLVADEPTTALDVGTQREVLALIDALVREDGLALLLISHDLGVMAHSVQRLAVMYGGSLVETGPCEALLRAPAHPYTRGLVAARPRLGLARGTRLPVIPGRVPDLHERPPGCPFANRCAQAQPDCRLAMPSETPRADDRGHLRCLHPVTPGPQT